MVCEKCKKGVTIDICQNAVCNGHLECLISARRQGVQWTSRVCYYAILYGHLHCLMWARKNGCKYYMFPRHEICETLHCIIYLIKCGEPALQAGDTLDKEIYYHAIMNGSLHNLIYVKTHTSLSGHISLHPEEILLNKNTFECPMWARKNGILDCTHIKLIQMKTTIDFLIWYKKCDGSIWYNMTNAVCSLDSFIWLHKNIDNYFIHRLRILEGVAFRGSLICLMWLGKQGIPYTRDICQNAVLKGHFDILLFLRKSGAQWHNTVCSQAADNDYLHILIWARRAEPPCPWNKDIYTHSYNHGNLLLLKWLRRNNAPWDNKEYINAAFASRCLEGLIWTRKCGSPWNIDVCSQYILDASLPCLIWARHKGCPWNEETCDEAKESNALSILKWIHANNSPCSCCIPIYIASAPSLPEETCNICMEPLDDTTVQFFRCRHHYHRVCMDTMLQQMRKKHCSICDRGT